jgi:hypothetical protein
MAKNAKPKIIAEAAYENAHLVLEQASPNEGKVQKHENLQLFPVFLE